MSEVSDTEHSTLSMQEVRCDRFNPRESRSRTLSGVALHGYRVNAFREHHVGA